MENKDFQISENPNETQENSQNESLKSKQGVLKQPLTQRKKIFLALIFIIGIALSYPTVLPLGVLCTAILLFQRNKKANIAALLLFSYQLMWVLLLAPNL